MAYGADRFLTTHTGSLPRPEALIRTMFAKEEGVPLDRAALAVEIRAAVGDGVQSQEAYLVAIAEAMRREYEAIAGAGITLQIDCPDLAMGRHIQYADLTVAEFRKRAALHIEALNHALANIPPERARMHLCWGNYE